MPTDCVVAEDLVGKTGVFIDGWEIFGIARIRRITGTRLYIDGPGSIRQCSGPFWLGRDRGHDGGGAWAGRRMLGWTFDDAGEAERFAVAYRAVAAKWEDAITASRLRARQALEALDAEFRIREANLEGEFRQRREALREHHRATLAEARQPYDQWERDAVRGFEGEADAVPGPARLRLSERAPEPGDPFVIRGGRKAA